MTRNLKTPQDRAAAEVEVLTRRAERLTADTARHKAAWDKAETERRQAVELLEHAKRHPALRADTTDAL